MPLFIPSRSNDEPGVPPAWLEVQRASKIFDEMCKAFINEVRRLPFEPVPGSVRARDAAVDELAVQLVQCARDHFLFALDHALGTSKCLKYPPTSHAAYACARTMIETCSTLHWLLETGENTVTKDRFARVLELYSRDVWNERKFDLHVLESTGKTEKEIRDSSEQRVEGAIAIADLLSISHKRKDRENRPIFATLMDATARVGTYVEDADLDYRLYSRIMHCETPAVAETWLVHPDPFNPGELLYNPELALRLVKSLSTWVARAGRALYSYCGHDLNEMDRRIQSYTSRLRIDEHR